LIKKMKLNLGFLSLKVVRKEEVIRCLKLILQICHIILTK
jgi:hypothetical protein